MIFQKGFICSYAPTTYRLGHFSVWGNACSKLPIKPDPEYTTHAFLELTFVSGRRGRRKKREEKWKRKGHLGIGVFGIVRLKEC